MELTKEICDLIDRADTMRGVAGDLANEYRDEGDVETASLIEQLFDGLPDESAARLLELLEETFGVTR